MTIQNLLGSALYTRLTTTGGTALWGTRVYDRQSPAGTAGSVPYVVFAPVSGGEIPLTPTRTLDIRYAVRCIAASSAEARSGAAYIESALRGGSLTLPGWAHLGTTEGETLSAVENLEGRQFWADGALYRIRADKVG